MRTFDTASIGCNVLSDTDQASLADMTQLVRMDLIRGEYPSCNSRTRGFTFGAAADQTVPSCSHLSYAAVSRASCSSRPQYSAGFPFSARRLMIASTMSRRASLYSGFLTPLRITAAYLTRM